METGLNFGEAIEAAKAGRFIRRAGWNGKSMHVYLEEASGQYMPRADGKGKLTYSRIGDIDPHFVMFTAQGTRQPGWLASQADMLSDDWQLVPYEEMK